MVIMREEDYGLGVSWQRVGGQCGDVTTYTAAALQHQLIKPPRLLPSVTLFQGQYIIAIIPHINIDISARLRSNRRFIIAYGSSLPMRPVSDNSR